MIFMRGIETGKKIVLSVFGVTLLIVGVALLVLPGPGILVIFIGLVVLAGEYVWAKKFLKKFREESGKIRKKIKRFSKPSLSQQ
ncbi:hypothetical protein CO038_00705 [Candidatus Pacearchaeota archaeon CG_4_9_14_0_2_um_filter_39_13]|nr:MAG: hypothetical protein CO038_00705 [Candidatus Pacearchaeota archaeon CG_4_9_14_0_2_um_filter_39_13]